MITVSLLLCTSTVSRSAPNPGLLYLCRSLKMPPEPIADVLGAVLMLLGIRDTSWLSMKKFLGNRGVKEDILNFDARRIDPQLRAKVPSNALQSEKLDKT